MPLVGIDFDNLLKAILNLWPIQLKYKENVVNSKQNKWTKTKIKNKYKKNKLKISDAKSIRLICANFLSTLDFFIDKMPRLMS